MTLQQSLLYSTGSVFQGEEIDCKHTDLAYLRLIVIIEVKIVGSKRSFIRYDLCFKR